jgi:hypothetical protein
MRVQPDQTLAISGNASNADSTLDTWANGFNSSQQAGAARGTGYSVDLGLQYESAHGVRWAWTLADAFSEMAWSGVPEVTLSGSSTFNGQFPEGRKSRVSFRETLPVRSAMQLSWPLGRGRMEITNSSWGDFHFPSLGWGARLASGMEADLDYDFVFQTVGLRLGTERVRVMLRSDSLNLEQARALMLALELRW